MAFSVSPDWLTNAFCLFLLGLFLFNKFDLKESRVSVAFLVLGAFSVLLLFDTDEAVPVFPALFFVLAWLSLIVSGYTAGTRGELVSWLAWAVFWHRFCRRLLAFAKCWGSLGILKVYFYLAQQVREAMGNFGQRNLFAQFLCWGLVAASYLLATKVLRACFCSGHNVFSTSCYMEWGKTTTYLCCRIYNSSVLLAKEKQGW